MKQPKDIYQTRFFIHTHYSESHPLHGTPLVASEWQLQRWDIQRGKYVKYKTLGHVPFYGQTTLDMFKK